MAIAIGPGNGSCGHCGGKLEDLRKGRSVILLCHGCGIVVGTGKGARRIIERHIAEGNAIKIDATPGTFAMRLKGGPSA